MTVLLGCPAGLKLVFDPDASKNATGKEHFCTPVDGVPCFYFYRGRLSVFEVPNWLYRNHGVAISWAYDRWLTNKLLNSDAALQWSEVFFRPVDHCSSADQV